MKLLMIFGECVEIREVDNLLHDEQTAGDYCSRTKTIRIDSSLRGDEFLTTLIHELVHALSDRISIRQALDHQTEEIIADTFAKAIVENFRLKLKE